MSLIFILQLILLVFCILIIAICIYEFYGNLSRYRIGLIPTLSNKINKSIIYTVDKYFTKIEQKKLKFIELGSGLGNISIYAAKDNKFEQIIAVEIDIIWHYFSMFLAWLNKTDILFIRKNIFKYKLPKNSFIYCYLGNIIMNKLYTSGKLNGHLVLSTSFPISNIKPTEIIKIGGFYRQVFVYDFRGPKKTSLG